MKKLRKLAGLIPALALSAVLTFGAGAQGIVNDVINGAENIVDDTVDTAENIVGGRDNTIGASDNNTAGNDIPDQIDDDVNDPNSGKGEGTVNGGTNKADPNPNTGIGVPFMTAGLVAVTAAGVAYLTRKRNSTGE